MYLWTQYDSSEVSSVCKQFWRYIFKLEHDRFLPHPIRVIIYNFVINGSHVVGN